MPQVFFPLAFKLGCRLQGWFSCIFIKNIIQIPLFCIFNTLRDVVQSSAHRVDNESVASLETKPLNYCLNAVDAQNVQSNQDLL